jgi:uncharacterized phiE125 gp8 family phage protein
MALVLKTAPTVEPVTLAEAKLHCRVDLTADDTLITALIVAARQYLEEAVGRSLVTRTYELTVDLTADPIPLPMPPLGAVSKVESLDTDGGVATTLTLGTHYTIDTVPVVPTVTVDVPLGDTATIKVTYTAGYGATAATVPQLLRQALLLMVGHWYANRESVAPGDLREVPAAFNALVYAMRVWS